MALCAEPRVLTDCSAALPLSSRAALESSRAMLARSECLVPIGRLPQGVRDVEDSSAIPVF